MPFERVVVSRLPFARIEAQAFNPSLMHHCVPLMLATEQREWRSDIAFLARITFGMLISVAFLISIKELGMLSNGQTFCLATRTYFSFKV